MKISAILSRSTGIVRCAALSCICVAAAVPSAAIAGEAYVTNSSRFSHGRSESNFDIQSLSEVNGYRQFKSTAAKIYLDGAIGEQGKGLRDDYKVSKVSNGFSEKSFGASNKFGDPGVRFDDFTVHAAFSVEEGNEESFTETEVDGFTKSVDFFKEHSHTSAAGIR